MMDKRNEQDWFRGQSEDELMAEANEKELKLRRNRLQHAFKDEINRLTGQGKSLTMDEKFALFRPYYEQMDISPDEMQRIAFVQYLQRAMGVRGTDEKKTDERDIYTDTSTGTVGNIRLSNDLRFIQNCKRRFDERVKKNRKYADICRTSLERIQREAPQQTELWQDEAGACRG